MITVNSQTRGAAKKLLTLLGHNAVDVRTMTIAALTVHVTRAINEGLITLEGAQHALSIAPEKRAPKTPDGDGRNAPEVGDDTDDTDNEGEGDSNNSGDTGDGNENENDSDENGDAPEGEQESKDAEGERGEDSDSESESDSEGEGDDEGDSESEGDSDSDSDSDSDNDSDSDDSDDGDDSDSDDSDDDSENESDDESENENESDDESENDNESESENENDDEEIEHDMLSVVLKYVRAGLNVALVGPAGTGKSYMARQVAAKLDRRFYVNGAMLSKYDLIGYCDAGGVYHSTPAYDAFVHGGVHCFDELDASAPDAVVAFNGMTDDQPFYTFPNGQQDQHADYVAIACMNTYGNGANADYVGRYKQDAASMSRFVKVFIDYSPEVEARCGSADIVTRVQSVREACKALSIRHIVSTRMIIQAETARKAKATKREIDRDIIFAGLDENAVKQIKAQIAKAKREAVQS